MFYLNHFFKALMNFRISGLLFVVFSLTLITATHNRKSIKKFFSLSTKSTSLPYFNALISNDSNLVAIERKMRKLPGVKNVRIKKAVEVSKELGALQVDLNSDVLKSLSNINYSSVTIELSNSIQNRSQSLIKEYLTRLVGDKSITISKVKNPKRIELSKNSPGVLMHKWGDLYIIGILSILWFASCLSFGTYLKNYSFLIEKFQRKTKVDMKIFAFGISFLFIFGISINLYFSPKVSVAETAFLIVAFCLSLAVFSKRNEFRKLV
jgi:hypothetical protein